VLPKPVSAAPASSGPTSARAPTRTSRRIRTSTDRHALTVPQIDPKGWRLRIHGLVDHEVTLTYDELLARPLIERWITLACVSNEIGGDLISNARFLGAPLADLLREAGVHPDADQLLATSEDGMTIGSPTAVGMDGRDAMLAVGMNGEPLRSTTDSRCGWSFPALRLRVGVQVDRRPAGDDVRPEQSG